MKQPTAGRTEPWMMMIEKPLVCLRVGQVLLSIHLAYEGQTAGYWINANQLVISPHGEQVPQTMIAVSELDSLRQVLGLAVSWLHHETLDPDSVKNRLERFLLSESSAAAAAINDFT